MAAFSIIIILSIAFNTAFASKPSFPSQSTAAPPMPEDHEGRTVCKGCHETGVADAPLLPPSPDHTVFPDDYVMCSGCHELVLSPTPSPTIAVTPSLPLPPEECGVCHEEYEGWQQSIHAEKGVNCLVCHSGVETVPHEEVVVDLAVCSQCHGGRFQLEVISITCNSCHDPHSQTLEVEVAKLCSRCHSEEYQRWSDSAHGLAGVACEKCHRHAEVGHVHRLVEVSSVLCGSCHVEQYRLEIKHDINCADCHEPHSQDLRKKVPELCDRCHDDIYRDWNMSPHKVEGVSCDVCHPHAESGHVHRWINASSAACGQCHKTFEELSESKMAVYDITCTNCHNPHSQEIRTPTVSTLCGRCHNQTTSPEYYFWNASVHKAVGASCETCHMYSEGERFRHNFTQPLLEEACEQCHAILPSGELHALQYRTEYEIKKAEEKIRAAEGVIAKAKSVFKVSEKDPLMVKAESMLAEAEHILEMVKNEKSRGFHAPILTHMLISQAFNLGEQSQRIALELAGSRSLSWEISLLIALGIIAVMELVVFSYKIRKASGKI